VSIEWPDRDSREWFLGPRGGSLEPFEEAAAHLPGVADGLGALLCVPQSPPTVWLRDDVVDDLSVWDAIKSLVMAYDSGDRDEQLWTSVLDGQGHVVVLAAT
jgi:hypothetical protein